MIIQSPTGRYKGTEVNDIYRFLGIPYAVPPVGNLRFRRAVPVSRTTELRETLEFPSKAPQPNAGILSAEDPVPASEDCLYLHVWSPSSLGRHPVLVFFHGGAFVMGEASARLYDGAAFAGNGDLVVVSVQYRLGLFGFSDFRLMNSECSRFDTNCGLSDQIEALRWIQANITAFGGDPDNVTVMGESAGASSVLALMTSPAARGLFHKAIAQSPAVDAVMSSKESVFWAMKAIELLGLKIGDTNGLLEMTTEESVEVSEKMMSEFNDLTPGVFPFGLVLDDLLPLSIPEAFSSGNQQVIPLLIGTNQDEVTAFLRRPDPWVPTTEKQLSTLFQHHPLWDETLICSHYPGLPDPSALHPFGRDLLFAVGNYDIALSHSEKASVFRYQFDFSTSIARYLGLGAFHGAELPFVFHNLDAELRKIIGKDTEQAKKMADRIHSAWIGFIREGNPNSRIEILWKPFTASEPGTFRINEICQMEENADHSAWKIWKNIK